ncbi:ion channel [Indiicoccus explosivorum]|uniref:ion channel n=1 Tax=Indiicoccus explosivorum TaxID=1917864 RepID=UPI000B44D9B6|nr:ion channel [Indiicoccus explosivorum]
MEILFLVFGIGLLILVTVDILWTSIWVDGGGGPVSSRLSSAAYKTVRFFSRDKSLALSITGPLILMITLMTWIALTWGGWLFIFAGGEETFLDTRDDLPVSWTERIYFTGYLIFTLGIGDYVPKDGIWQVISAVAAGNGFLFITLGASYVLSVLGAVTTQRSFASSITGLGMTGSEIVKKAWDGKDFGNIDLILNATSAQLSTLTAQHNAYPILHYYHPRDVKQSAPYAVAALDEALMILKFGVPERNQPNMLLLEAARSTIQEYLVTLTSAFVSSSREEPPRADLDFLRDAGLPTMDDHEFNKQLDKWTEHRKRLYGIVKSDARDWPEKSEN